MDAVCRADIYALRYNQHMTDGQTTVARFDQWAPWYNDSALQPMLYQAVLVRAAAERLPFADAVFDLVTATLTYRHWADQAAGVAEVGRVLTPGGVFGLAARLTPARGSPRRWPRGPGRARLPAPLVAALTGAGLHANSVNPDSSRG
jgi:SAM-dependent methyltransferase